VPPAGFTFNQFLVIGDEPLLFHTGLRRMFPSIRTALSRILPPEHLRWISFGHFEADECGAMNEWLAIASQAKVAQGQTGCLVSLNDMADRTPQVLHDGEVIDLAATASSRGRDVADVRPQSSVPHPVDDLTQLGAIGHDNEVDRQTVGGPRLGAPDDGHQCSSGSNPACGPLLYVATDDIEHQIDAADVFQRVVVEVEAQICQAGCRTAVP
jgi:hypothetical protein